MWVKLENSSENFNLNIVMVLFRTFEDLVTSDSVVPLNYLFAHRQY
jgi:hypothetical protein